MRVLHFLQLKFHALSIILTTFNASKPKRKGNKSATNLPFKEIIYPNKNNEQPLNVQKRCTEMQKDMSQKLELMVSVNESGLIVNKDQYKDGANGLTSLKNLMSLQTLRLIDNNIVEDKAPSK